MADVTVFVDDAVRGRLPAICAKDAVPTVDVLRVHKAIGEANRLGIAWLLLFAGPLGWLVMLVLLGRDSGEKIAVDVPLSEPAYQRLRRAKRTRGVGWALDLVAIPLFFLLILAIGPNGWATPMRWALIVVMVAAVVTGVVLTVVGERRVTAASFTVDIDGSRRWVTIRGVHPSFAAACRERLAGIGHRPLTDALSRPRRSGGSAARAGPGHDGC